MSSLHTSSPPPGPTGSPLRRPRTTSERVDPAAMFQVMSAEPPARLTRTPLSTSPGGGTGVPTQVPPRQASPVVQAFPSLHAVPSAACRQLAQPGNVTAPMRVLQFTPVACMYSLVNQRVHPSAGSSETFE